MLHYIIQTIAFQLFFLLLYDVFLKRETFFNWNRFYLVIAMLLSIVLPFIKIESFKTIVPEQYIIRLPEIVLGTQQNILLDEVVLKYGVQNIGFVWSWSMILYLGFTIATVLFLYKIINLTKLIYKSPKQKKGKLFIVTLINSNMAFSFFNYVFLGELILPEDRKSILKHELIHVQQKHSVDLLLFEILRIIFWFNPLVYVFQSQISNVHEFIADDKAVKQTNKKEYYENLLSQIFDVKQISFINPFFKQSLIKKRIIMLSKTKSKQILKLKYVLLIPMVTGMLVYTSCSQQETAYAKEASLTDQIEQLSKAIEAKASLTKEEKTALSKLAYSAKFSKTLGEDLDDKSIDRKVEEIELESYSDDIGVPFSVVDETPIFPGCENNEGQKACTSQKIAVFVNKNFNVKLAENLGLKGVQRIVTVFKIDNTGQVVEVKARAPHPDLEAEAIRVVSLLPKMIPGKHKGKAVKVPFSLPIKFVINE